MTFTEFCKIFSGSRPRQVIQIRDFSEDDPRLHHKGFGINRYPVCFTYIPVKAGLVLICSNLWIATQETST